MLFKVLKNVIADKGYDTKEEAQSYVDVFYAKKRLTEEQYTELSDLVDTTYLVQATTTA
jgi:hypothetical protein